MIFFRPYPCCGFTYLNWLGCHVMIIQITEIPEEKMENRQRILWIDVAKGICMISVIAGHLGVEAINNIVFSYHLTVFFLLSGYMLKNDLNHESLNRKFRKTMTPYFITCAAVMAMDVFNQIVLNKVKTFRSITRVIGVDLLRSYFASGSIKTFGAIELGKG